MPKISVIVPVYMVEDYLDRCVQSIIDQTHRELEVILVNDGSPDRCGAMCEMWAQKDPRVCVVHKENGGLSDARNVGIERATGAYLTFVDSDDYIHPRMLEILLAALEQSGAKIAVAGFCRTKGERLPAIDDWQVDHYSPEQLYRQRIVDATIACAKLYHADCFQGIRYPVGKLHEDEFITYQILFSSPIIPMVDIPMYGYYCNPQSIMESKWSPKRLVVLDAFRQQAEFFKKRGYKGLQRMRNRDILKYMIRSMDEISNSDDPGRYAQLKRDLKKQGRLFLIKQWRTGEFELERDGWMIGYFYPQVVKVHGYMTVLKRKLKKAGR